MDDPQELIESLRHGAAASPSAYAAALSRALSDWHMRETAARALIRIGVPAIEPVGQLLLSPDAAVRGCAVGILGQIGGAAAVPALCAALRDAEGNVRNRAIAALARIGDPSGVPPLIELLRHSGVETPRAAAAALGLMGDRRAILPLWEALLDGPWELDPDFSKALVQLARREPGPEVAEVLERLHRELRHLDGESRSTLTAVRSQLEASLAAVWNRPIPAAAPAPSPASLPLPAARMAADPATLPLPAAASPAPPGGARILAAPPAHPPERPAPPAPPSSTGSDPAPPDDPAAAMLSRFRSVEAPAVRSRLGLQPVLVDGNIVFRQSKKKADIDAAGCVTGLAVLWLVFIVIPLSTALPAGGSAWLAAALLVLLPPLWVKLSSCSRRLYSKVDPGAREIIIYPLLAGRWTHRWTHKRKRLPLDQIDFFLGRLWSTDDSAGERLYAALRDGRLVTLVEELGGDCHAEANARILGITCGKPAYLLDGQARFDDSLSVRSDGGFAVRNRARLIETARRRDAPEAGACPE